MLTSGPLVPTETPLVVVDKRCEFRGYFAFFFAL
jgi:hypothetical protein